MKPFYLGTYHVTLGQFRRFAEDTAYKTDAEKGEKPGAWCWNADKNNFEFSRDCSWHNTGFKQTDMHPVVNVSWDDAVAFGKWLSGKEGKTYRLPTEAEWEYSCRAGSTTRYYSGDDPETLKASDGYFFTAPVGLFQPNSFGLYDMQGNVWQWCSDWYGEKYYSASPIDDPAGPNVGDSRVFRGGSWNYRSYYSRSASRFGVWPDFRLRVTGLRVARTQ